MHADAEQDERPEDDRQHGRGHLEDLVDPRVVVVVGGDERADDQVCGADERRHGASLSHAGRATRRSGGVARLTWPGMQTYFRLESGDRDPSYLLDPEEQIS